jgi:basic membrane protein A and related proteins
MKEGRRMKLKSLLVALIAVALMSTGLISEIAAKPFRVAIVMPSTINDYGWCQPLYEAMVEIQEELGKDKFEFTYSELLFMLDDADAAIRDYASEGYDLVIAHGSQYGSLLKNIAPDFPKTSFCWGTGGDPFTDLGINNVYGYSVLANQSGFALGALAGKLTRSGIIGWVGPVEAGSTKLFADGFKSGVKYSNPKAKVNATWTGSYSDLALASEAAQAHIAAGADILAGHAQIQVAIINACAQQGAYFIGAQANQIPFNPEVVVACQLSVWKLAFMPMIKAIQGGKLGGERIWLTLENGGQEIVVNDPLLQKGFIGDIVQEIIDGKIKTN